MKQDSWAYIIVVGVVSLALVFVMAILVTFVIGLFVPYPFTLMNIVKVWLAVMAFNIVTANLRKAKEDI